MRALAVACAIFAASAALAFPQPIQPRGSGSGTPSIGNLSAAMTAGAATGTPILTPTIAGLTGCSWTLTPTTNFSQSSSTGLVSTTSTATSAATYTPTTTCSASSAGQSITISAALSIVATGAAYSPSLDFSDPRNSMYL